MPRISGWRWNAVLLAAAMPAQELVHRDGPLPEAAQAGFDPGRGRLVIAARLGETWECDGNVWFRRAERRGDWADARFAWDGSRLIAFATTQALNAETWMHDGMSWTRYPPVAQPPARTDAMMAFDSWRGRVVLFAGTATVGPNYYLTDTWEWDGVAWTQLTPAAGPSWRHNSGMAFDPLRGVTVLFGGDGQTGFSQDTWEWNGAAWTQRSPAVQPSPRTGPAMAFDAIRGRIVLHGGLAAGGLQNDLWTWDGVVWQALPTNNMGPACYKHSLHHDPARGELLVFGGNPPALSVLDLAGTWRPGPAVAYVAATGGPGPVAIDPGTGGLVRFGSLFDNGTHVWDRANWRTLRLPLAPPARIFSSMWWDGQSTWLFGGTDTLRAVTYGDLWRWDGAQWWPASGGTRPSARSYSAVAYDGVRGVAVLFGGYGSAVLNDTWTFDGTTWQLHNPAVRPPARYYHGLAFDPARARTVLFGGTGAVPSQLRNDTWEWDGATWQQVVTPQSPPAIGSVALGWDTRRQRVLLSQSGTQTIATLPLSLWTYDGVTWSPLQLQQNLAIQPVHSVLTLPGEIDPLLADGYAVLQVSVQPASVANLGAGCGTVPLRLWVRTLPRPGATQFGFEVDHAAANAATVLLLASAPAAAVVAGCAVGVDPGGLLLFSLAGAGGAVAVPVPLPATPALLGVSAYGQAFALAPGTASGFAASPVLRVVGGD